MLIYNENGIAVYACSIEPDGTAPRHEKERRAVARLLREALPDCELAHHPSGAPYLIGTNQSISISHCSQLAAIAIGDYTLRIGIDCETADRRQQLERVKSRFLSQSQMDHWQEFPRILDAWCIKEALYKALLTPGLPLEDIPLPTTLPGEVEFEGKIYQLFKIEPSTEAINFEGINLIVAAASNL